MGYGAWKSSDWDNYKTSNGITNKSTVKSIYKSNSIKDTLNPFEVKYRESCDSNDHPNSTPIILGLDVTGSMGSLAEEIAKNALNRLILELYDKKPIEDPHVMIMAIGDAFYDTAPVQVSQFEADIRIAEQLTDIYFEGGGGGNDGESYLAAWYFAARHTKTDSFEKHNKKGFLFTIGDEPCHKKLTKSQIKNIFGDDVERDLTSDELLAEVSRMYEVFHFCVGNYHYYDSLNRWKTMLGERAMNMTDYTKIPEVVESTLAVMGGMDADTAAAQWDGSTSIVVKEAIGGLKAVKESNSLIEF